MHEDDDVHEGEEEEEGEEEHDEDEEDEDEADPLAAAAAAYAGEGGDSVAMSGGGFAWDDFGSPTNGAKSQSVDDDDDEEAEAEAEAVEEKSGAGGRRGKKAQEKVSMRQKEAAIVERETELLGDTTPQTSDDFERLLLGSPHSSYLWLRYVDFTVSLAELDKARELLERALKTVELRREDERFNLWAALLNFEKAHGTDEAFVAAFRRATAGVSAPHRVHLHVAGLHERAGDRTLADAAYDAACKKFRRMPEVWGAWLGALMARQPSAEHEEARRVLQRAVDAMPMAQHVELISKFAQLEFKFGDAERGRTVFDGILSNYPKRVDVWSVYLDMEIKAADAAVTRRLFERVTSLRLSSKKMKFFFKRYLEYARGVAADDELVEHVKERARAWVESATEAEAE